MRIGEVAALAGVSTRTVRYYHHVGLLPEPVRRSNGYRDYRLRDAVALSRIRKLAELGLSLDELRDALADDDGGELREVLLELDADLARQQESLAERRERVALLLAETDLRPGSMVSADLAALLGDLAGSGSAVAGLDGELLALVGTAAGPAEQARIFELIRPLTEPAALARGHELYGRLDALADAGPGDPRVSALAADFAAHLPAPMVALMRENAGDTRWLGALSAELSPAQAEVFRLLMGMLTGTS